MSSNIVRYMKTNDTGEPVRILVTNESDGSAVDLTGADAVFLMYEIRDDGTKAEIVNAIATVESPETDGYITYNWQAGDTTVIGAHLALFEVTYAGGVVESYPRQGYIEIRIEEDLNDA